MEDSVGEKKQQREFALASVAELSSAASASPGITRFTCDGSAAELQIHHESQQIPLSVDLRSAQVRFRLVLNVFLVGFPLLVVSGTKQRKMTKSLLSDNMSFTSSCEISEHMELTTLFILVFNLSIMFQICCFLVLFCFTE